MKLLSNVFQPMIKTPKNAIVKNSEITCKSQKLLLECGLVRPTAAGLFALMPLARRALHKLEGVVRTCVEDAGAQEILLPALSSSKLWEQTGRIHGAPAELMKLEDRHGKTLLLAPTHEEGIADLLADVGPLSYKQLPIILYQISNKFRDEHRPKHGLLRAREFSMLDVYGAHGTQACAAASYQRLLEAYQRLFELLRLPVYRVSAPCGAMGGSLSHEWQLCAAAGEDRLAVCGVCRAAQAGGSGGSGGEGCCLSCGGDLNYTNSIEVGHTFILGTKYSEALSAHFVPQDSPAQPIIMSCYGIGVTRLLAAGLEALSSENSIRWPDKIAPFQTIIIGPKSGSREHGAAAARLDAVRAAAARAGDVLLDDRDQLTIGRRLQEAARVGYPNIVILGRGIVDNPPQVEVHTVGAPPRLMTIDELRDMNQEIYETNV